MSRLASLTAFLFLIALVALFFTARAGDVLSIVVLSVLAAIALIVLGVCLALFAGAIWSRTHQSQTASVGEMANAQRAMAGAMASWGRMSQYGPPTIPALPEGQAPIDMGSGLMLPQITTYRAVGPDEVENDAL